MRHSLNKTLNTFFLKGVFLFLSLTIQADDKEDFVYDLSLATQGVSVSQYNTAINYSLGRGISFEIEKAIYWYIRASDQGHSKAPFNLGILYAKGEGGLIQDLSIALDYFELSANRGNKHAKLFLEAVVSLNKNDKQSALNTLCCPEALIHGMVDSQPINSGQ